MRIARLTATIAVLTLFTADALAQRGGAGRWRKPEEITNRIGLFFASIKGPESAGDKVAELATVELVRAAASANQLSVIYLSNEADDQTTRQNFEWRLGQSTELGIQLKCFHCGQINLADEPALNQRFGKKAPLFVVFDKNSKPTEVSMAGYKPAANALRKALEKAGSGAFKPSLSTFAKRYGNLLEDLERILTKKAAAEQGMAKAGDDNGKRKKLQKELQKLETEQQKVLDKEKDLLDKMRLPERSAGAKRIGDRPRRARNRGGEGGGEGGGRGGGRRGGGE